MSANTSTFDNIVPDLKMTSLIRFLLSIKEWFVNVFGIKLDPVKVEEVREVFDMVFKELAALLTTEEDTVPFVNTIPLPIPPEIVPNKLFSLKVTFEMVEVVNDAPSRFPPEIVPDNVKGLVMDCV
jgi:hypothetical protein